MGDDTTLLYDVELPSSMIKICKNHGKEKGGPWECHSATNFFGWEADRVVAVTGGGYILEPATRGRTELILILAEPEEQECKEDYQETKGNIKDAADEGLVDVKVIENGNSCVYCCNVM